MFNGQNVLCIGTHPDDIAFSIGGLLSKGNMNNVTVLDVFSLSSFLYDRQLSKEVSGTVTRLRKQEERRFCNSIRANCCFLDFPDSSLRGYTGYFVKSKLEEELENAVLDSIEQKLIDTEYDSVLYPLGIGDHIDHLIVSSAVQNLSFKHNDIVFFGYEDLPYAGEGNINNSLRRLYDEGYVSFMIKYDEAVWKAKVKLLKIFESQVRECDISICKEYANVLCNRTGYCERIWRRNE